MEKEKKSFVDWIKEHKTQLIVAGVSITAIIAVILGAKNQEALEQAWISLRKLVEKTPAKLPTADTVTVAEIIPIQDIVDISIVPTNRIPHEVTEHLRNLPEGWSASAEKIATAAEHGYNLMPGQTWVEAYRTGGLAA